MLSPDLAEEGDAGDIADDVDDARQFSQLFLGCLQREACTNGHGKTTSMIPLIVFGEFGSPERRKLL